MNGFESARLLNMLQQKYKEVYPAYITVPIIGVTSKITQATLD